MLSMLLVAFHLKSYSCDCAELLISLPGSIKAGLQCETDDRVLGRSKISSIMCCVALCKEDENESFCV